MPQRNQAGHWKAYPQLMKASAAMWVPGGIRLQTGGNLNPEQELGRFETCRGFHESRDLLQCVHRT